MAFFIIFSKVILLYMKKILFLNLLLIFASCNKQKTIENNQLNHFFSSHELGQNNNQLRFYITASFDECGEWGGHDEILEFFGKDNQVYLNYRKSRVDCNTISELYSDPEFHQWIKNDTIKLTNNHKKAINTYLKTLIDSKLNESYVGHSGRTFSAFKTDSTFNIEVFNTDDYKINTLNFNQLLQSFKLDTVW